MRETEEAASPIAAGDKSAHQEILYGATPTPPESLDEQLN
jgi:hypothetical protein